MALLALAVVGCGEVATESNADAPPPTGAAAITVPSEDEVVPDDKSFDEYEEIAAERGVSVEEVEVMLATQARLSDFADDAIDDPSVLEFRFTEDGRGGVLVVEQGFDTASVFPDLKEIDEIEVKEAELSIDQRQAAETALQRGLDDLVGDNLIGPAVFDGYDTTYTISLKTIDGIDVEALEEQFRSAVTAATGGTTEVGIIIIEPEPTEEALGR